MSRIVCPCCGQETDAPKGLLDLGSGVFATAQGRSERLNPKESLLLDALLRANGRILGEDQIAEALWGGRDEPEDVPKNIQVHVHNIRRKVRATGISVETVYGLGYRLALPGAP